MKKNSLIFLCFFPEFQTEPKSRLWKSKSRLGSKSSQRTGIFSILYNPVQTAPNNFQPASGRYYKFISTLVDFHHSSDNHPDREIRERNHHWIPISVLFLSLRLAIQRCLEARSKFSSQAPKASRTPISSVSFLTKSLSFSFYIIYMYILLYMFQFYLWGNSHSISAYRARKRCLAQRGARQLTGHVHIQKKERDRPPEFYLHRLVGCLLLILICKKVMLWKIEVDPMITHYGENKLVIKIGGIQLFSLENMILTRINF